MASFESPAAALALLGPARQAFEAEQLALYAAVTRLLTGRLMAKAAGDDECTQAAHSLRALGVVAPDSFERMLAPAR